MLLSQLDGRWTREMAFGKTKARKLHQRAARVWQFRFFRQNSRMFRVCHARAKVCIHHRPVMISPTLQRSPLIVQSFTYAPEGKVFPFSKRTLRLSHRHCVLRPSSSSIARSEMRRKDTREREREREKEERRRECRAGRSRLRRVDQPATRKSHVYVIFLALG